VAVDFFTRNRNLRGSTKPKANKGYLLARKLDKSLETAYSMTIYVKVNLGSV
jgi:hypothetical protein